MIALKAFCGFVRHNRKLGLALALIVMVGCAKDSETYDEVYKNAFNVGYQVGLKENAVYINTNSTTIYVPRDSVGTTGIYIGKYEPQKTLAAVKIIIPDSTTVLNLGHFYISSVDTGIVVK